MTERPPKTGAAPHPADEFFTRLFAAVPAFSPFEPPAVTFPNLPAAASGALATALGCPDFFMIDAPGRDRAGLAAELAVEATRAGRRVLIVAPAPAADATVCRLAGRCEPVGRAVAPGEPVELLPPESACRTASALQESALGECRKKLADELARIEAEETAARQPHPPDGFPAVSDLRIRQAVERAERDEARRSTAAALAANTELASRLRAELDSATAEAKRRHGPVGFLKGLFAKDNPSLSCDDLQKKLAATEASVAELTEAAAKLADELAALDAAHAQELESLNRAEAARHEREIAARLAELAAQRDRIIAAAHAEEAGLATSLSGRPMVVVAPPAGVGADPLSSDRGARFDVLIVADAEHVSEPEVRAAARLAGRWVLIGDVSAPPRPGRPAGLFQQLWHRLHRRPWIVENGRLVARLADGPRPGRLRAEPLADQPDIELRFLPGHGLTLGEVVFPAGCAVADAKAFLATELGEFRLSPLGPVHWHEADDRLTACWPAADDSWDGTWVDLGNGVRERVVGSGPDAMTAAVAFDRAAGWHRPSAEEWLARHTVAARSVRTAVIPRSAVKAETRELVGAAG